MIAALETSGLGKRYGRTWALRDCSLRLPAGRVAALVGPNGAGKTTLLHLAVGLSNPDAGAIRVLGESPDEGTALMNRIGFVAQDTPLYRDFTVAKHITMGARLNHQWDAALATDRLRRLGIPQNRTVGNLSGGQRAQIALALALAKRPDLLVLDEPLASLDPLARREFLQTLMDDVAEHGTTVLLSSHLLGDLERVCDHLIVLHAGRVQVLGDVVDLLARHKSVTGPRADPASLVGVSAVVQASHTDKQTTALVRTDARFEREYVARSGHDPQWRVDDINLEDLVLAYLSAPSAGALPGPSRTDQEVAR